MGDADKLEGHPGAVVVLEARDFTLWRMAEHDPERGRGSFVLTSSNNYYHTYIHESEAAGLARALTIENGEGMTRNNLRPAEPEPEEPEEAVGIDPAETELFDKLRDPEYVDFVLVGGTLQGVPALFICINHARDLDNELDLEPVYVRLTPEMAKEVSFDEDEQADEVEGRVVSRGPAKRASRGRGRKTS